ncbi:MAG: UDP-N-acetylglucosamine 1-carboxyvinyltransferase [Coprococcus catus]|nr:UDP-N-acetylglucosamine 1-carboxyvinyltransferase [Coprococcus catus]
MFLGALLGKMRKAVLPKPGGCAIGKRPIDLHLAALERLGAAFSCEGEAITAEGNRLHCGTIRLGLPSVGATENSILAAVLLPGETRIEHAAQEPEIDELIRFLNLRGGKLQRMGDAIVIEGGRRLHPVRFRIASDRIVAGTYLFAAAAAGGELHLQNYSADQTLAGVLLQMGGICRADHLGGMYFQMKHRPKALPGIRTAPYPGFPTDMQSQMLACLCQARGDSTVTEHIFENRYKVVPELIRMGGNITVDQRRAVIHGPCRMHGETVEAKELRGGAALVIAGLAAEGETVIHGSEHIERGYQDICRDLGQLGAEIRCITDHTERRWEDN